MKESVMRMPSFRRTIGAIALALTALSCSDAEELEMGFGFVSFVSDLPDLYGETEVSVEKDDSFLSIPVSLGCVDAVRLPAGKWSYVAQSRNGFDWEGTVDVVKDDCVVVSMGFEKSTSTFLAAYVTSEKYLPTEFLVDNQSEGILTRTFDPPIPNLAELPCDEVRRYFIDAAADGSVLISAAPIGIKRKFELRRSDGRARLWLAGDPGICLLTYSY